jgi:hypothetical protein
MAISDCNWLASAGKALNGIATVLEIIEAAARVNEMIGLGAFLITG